MTVLTNSRQIVIHLFLQVTEVILKIRFVYLLSFFGHSLTLHPSRCPCAAQSGFTLTAILLLQPSEGWDDIHVAPYLPIYLNLFLKYILWFILKFGHNFTEEHLFISIIREETLSVFLGWGRTVSKEVPWAHGIDFLVEERASEQVSNSDTWQGKR